MAFPWPGVFQSRRSGFTSSKTTSASANSLHDPQALAESRVSHLLTPAFRFRACHARKPAQVPPVQRGRTDADEIQADSEPARSPAPVRLQVHLRVLFHQR